MHVSEERNTPGGCGDSSAIRGTALELFQLAALLVGDTEEAVQLVEETVAGMEIDPCMEPATAREQAEQHLLLRGIAALRRVDASSFRSMPVPSPAGALCVEDDTLDATGISPAQLGEWLASDGRGDLRAWLRALPAVQRVIFVQRALLGRGNAPTARTLSPDPMPGEAVWTPEAVGEAYRLALCSLANSLAHAPAVAGQSRAAHA